MRFFFELWLILWVLTLPFVPYVNRVRRRRKYQRCLARIERLEIALGYRQVKPNFAQLRYHDPADFLELRPGAAWPTYINAGQMAAQQQQAYANTTLAKLIYEMQGASRLREDSL